jgi:hypothetical protein
MPHGDRAIALSYMTGVIADDDLERSSRRSAVMQSPWYLQAEELFMLALRITRRSAKGFRVMRAWAIKRYDAAT